MSFTLGHVIAVIKTCQPRRTSWLLEGRRSSTGFRGGNDHFKAVALYPSRRALSSLSSCSDPLRGDHSECGYFDGSIQRPKRLPSAKRDAEMSLRHSFTVSSKGSLFDQCHALTGCWDFLFDSASTVTPTSRDKHEHQGRWLGHAGFRGRLSRRAAAAHALTEIRLPIDVAL
jgi:hypothetical protein